jgi:outer membrane protein TolC
MEDRMTIVRISLLALALVSSPAAAALAQTAPVPPTQRVVGRVLTLDDAIAIALEAQPTIQATLYDYAAARARVREAFSPLLPQLSGSASAARSHTSVLPTSTTASGRVATVSRQPADTFLAQVQLSQLLFDFGKTMAATQVARKLAEVSAEGVELQRQTIALTVKEAYTNILLAQRLIRVQEQAVERAELNLSSAKGFYDVGTQPLSTVVRAEVDVANAKVDLINARNALRTARVALNTALAIDASTETEIQDNLEYQPTTLDRAALRAEALRQSPEYRQARLQSSVAEAGVQQASRNFLPNISGIGSYGGSQLELNPNWSLGLQFSWNIFDGGNLIAAYDEAKANLGAASARVKVAELTLIQNLEQSEIAVEAAQQRIEAARVLIASSQENFRLAQGRFDVGVGTILELTDAQLALTQAQNTEAQALADYRIALAQLDRAAGRR